MSEYPKHNYADTWELSNGNLVMGKQKAKAFQSKIDADEKEFEQFLEEDMAKMKRAELTKHRWKIAAMAMQGILANSNDHFRDALIDDAEEHEAGSLPNTVAMNAIVYADALLEKLEATSE